MARNGKNPGVSEALRERWKDPAFREKMAAAQRARKGKVPADVRAAMSERRRAWWASRTPEQLAEVKRNIGATSKGRLAGKVGSKHPGWKGGRHRENRDGYIRVYAPDHPNAVRATNGVGGYVLEHRLVMEKHLGRLLHKDEDVNHINGVKDDNRVENLRVVSHYAHYEEHGCPKCGHKIFTK